ncbi:nitrilase-related carbon-nitrogen hydrolase [Pyxidicoccus sp. 3LG]
MASSRVVTVICYEVFSRSLVLRGTQAGGELLAVLVSDRPLAGSRIAMEQSLGVVLLRAVEFQLPAVRASLGGISALISPDGRILARSEPGHSELLLASDAAHPNLATRHPPEAGDATASRQAQSPMNPRQLLPVEALRQMRCGTPSRR